MQLYKLSEIAKEENVSTMVLRKWEKQKLVVPIQLPSGQKRYTKLHRAIIRTIKKERGIYFNDGINS